MKEINRQMYVEEAAKTALILDPSQPDIVT